MRKLKKMNELIEIKIEKKGARNEERYIVKLEKTVRKKG